MRKVFFTFLKSTDQTIRSAFVEEFGDLEKDQKLLEEFSPMRDKDKIVAPLFVISRLFGIEAHTARHSSTSRFASTRSDVPRPSVNQPYTPDTRSMAFERPPDERSVKWNKRPLVWVTGRETKADRVPAQDFVFAALRQAVDEHETWTPPVTAIYRRAVTNAGGLCKAFETFGLESEIGCR